MNKLVQRNKWSDYLLLMKYIITERQLKNLRVRRNIFDELPKYVTSTFKWLNPKAFNNFDEFIERVIFSATRDYVGEFIDGPEEFDDLTNMIEPTVRDMVMGRYYDEILDYYNNHFKT
jgi:hypothetical protein